MKAKKRTAVNVVADTVRAMSSPFMSLDMADNSHEKVFKQSDSGFHLFGTVREKEMKDILDSAARSVSSFEIGESDIYTDPKNVYTSKEVKQFQDLVSGSDDSKLGISRNSVDGGVWDVSRRSGMKDIYSCYGH